MAGRAHTGVPSPTSSSLRLAIPDGAGGYPHPSGAVKNPSGYLVRRAYQEKTPSWGTHTLVPQAWQRLLARLIIIIRYGDAGYRDGVPARFAERRKGGYV